MSAPRRPLSEVLAAHAATLMHIEGVEGIGEARCGDEPCIRVYLRSEAAVVALPQELDGYVVEAVVTGVIRPREP